MSYIVDKMSKRYYICLNTRNVEDREMNKRAMIAALAVMVLTILILTAMVIVMTDIAPIWPCIVAAITSISGAAALISMARSSDRAYDERQIKARGDAGLFAFIVTMILVVTFGFMSYIAEDAFPITFYAGSLVCCLLGLTTFIIAADINDAYLNMSQKRKTNAWLFLAAGVVMVFLSGFWRAKAEDMERVSVVLTQGACWLAIATEMFIKMSIEKKEERMEAIGEKS